LGGAFVIREVIQATAQIEGLNLAISFASGSAEEATKNLQFLDDISEKLGLDALATRKGFQTLAGSFVGTGVKAEEQRDIFEKVSTAVSALNLSAADSEGVFLALGQIMSKGKVVAEELRRQIGNRLPGAFGIAARAMGVTTAEMDRLMSQGLIRATDFLPKFADELQRTFVGALDKSTKSLRANLNRLNNAFLQLKIAAGDEFVPSIEGLVKLLPLITKNLALIIKVTKIAIVTFISFKLATVLLTTGLSAYVIVTKATIVATRFLTGGLKAARIAMIAFGIATKLTPIGIIAGLLSVAVAAFLFFKDKIVITTKTFKGFRNAINIVSSALKGMFDVFAKITSFIFTKLQPAFDFIGNLFISIFQKIKAIFISVGKVIRDALIAPFQQAKSFISEFFNFIVDRIVSFFSLLGKIPGVKKVIDTFKKTFRKERKEFFDEENKLVQQISKVQKITQAIPSPPITPITPGGVTPVTRAAPTRIVSAAPRVFNINIEKLVETINNNVTNLTEGMNQSKKIIVESLLSALNDTQAIVR